jgi:integrase
MRASNGGSTKSARDQARAVSAMAYQLGCDPKAVPKDAVARHFLGRPHSLNTARLYERALRSWNRYLIAGLATPTRYFDVFAVEDPRLQKFAVKLRGRGLADSTIKAHIKGMTRLMLTLGVHPDELDEDAVDTYLAVRNDAVRRSRGRDMRAGSRNKILAQIRRYAKIMKIEDPTADIERSGQDHEHWQPVPADDLRDMRVIARSRINDPDPRVAETAKRMLVLTIAMSTMGLRISEASKIGPHLIVTRTGGQHGLMLPGPFVKGRHNRRDIFVPASRDLLTELRAHYRDNETVCPVEWTSSRAGGEYRAFASAWCGITVTPHQLRAYFATELYRRRRDLVLVQRRMRHSNVQTTVNYIADLDSDEDVRLLLDFDAEIENQPDTALSFPAQRPPLRAVPTAR